MVDTHINYRDSFVLDPAITYLNCSTISPLLKLAEEAGVAGIRKRAMPWKLTGEDWFTDAETLRNVAAKIFRTSDNNIALVPSVSYGLALAAKNLSIAAGKNIIVLDGEFPSNFYVWGELASTKHLQLISVSRTKGKSWTECILNKIDSNTGLVAVPNCHWTDGTLVDLERVSEATRSVNAYLVLDLSQSLGALPLNIEKIAPDFTACAGYKWMLGPYGMSYLYVSPRWHHEGEPLEYSWMTRKGSEDFKSLTLYTNEYREGARKFDMGQFSQFNMVPMCIAALRQIDQWGVEKIHEYISGLTALIHQYKLKTDEEAEVPTAGHFTAISLPSSRVEKIQKRLSAKKIIVGFRGTKMRISPHLFNNEDDIQNLLSCIEEA